MKLLTVVVLALAHMPFIITEDAPADSTLLVDAPVDSSLPEYAPADSSLPESLGDSSLLPQGCTDGCSRYIQPVCGTDGVTYRNNCFRNCASYDAQAHGQPPILVKYYGPCPVENCICPAVVDPVCASDGKTYANTCELACQNRRNYALGFPMLTIEYKGVCVSCTCDTHYEPVCASDGKTYTNKCRFDCENEIRKRKGLALLTIVSNGACGCNCTPYNDPICASDNKTYKNICELNCENLRKLQQGEYPLLYVSHRGPCACNCKYCPTNYQPVCGNNRNTYWNLCWLQCYSNCNVASGGDPIKYVKPGYC